MISRAALAVAACAATFAAFAIPACSSNDATPAPDGGDEAGDATPDYLVPPPIQRTQTEAELAPQRAACAFQAGAWPAETIGTDYPIGSDIPIDHVIVIMQENRSFDHYLGRLVAQGYYQPSELDAPDGGWSNPDSDGGLVVPHADDEYCYGVNHSWGAMHDDLDDGKLDHFVTQNNPDGQRTFFYEDDTVIPFYYALANTFSVGDRYFCSVLSSTWPNRFYLMAATSFGIGDNSFDVLDTADNPSPQIFSLLEAGGHSWKDYTDGPHMVEFFPNFGFSQDARDRYADVQCGLFGDLANGTLPDVAFVMGDEISETSDEGPSNLPGIGGQVVEAIVRAAFASPEWAHTAIFITYDENGGLADHVPPAKACPPDGYTPHDGNGNPLPGAFDTTGFRVPFIVVSPYARAHFVSHTTYDHAAITRFIETRFGLPALTARDANAAPMDMFDFQNPPFATPPNITAHTTVPQPILTQCNQTLAPTSCTH